LGLLLACVLVSRPALADQDQYQVLWQGLNNQDLQETLAQLANTVQYANRPPVSIGMLQQRARADIPRLTKVLQARGYFKAKISPKVKTKADRRQVIFQIELGPRFVLTRVDFDSERPLVQGLGFPEPGQLGLRLGQGTSTKALVQAGQRLQAYLRDRGYPFARVLKPEAIADHAKDQLRASFKVILGPRLRYGPLEINGLQEVHPNYVRKRLTWAKGQWYNATQVQDSRAKLLKSGLFSTVKINGQRTRIKDDLLPIYLELSESRPRTIKAGLEYSSDFDLGGKLEWSNRNLFGGGELLQIQSKANSIQKGLQTSLRLPDFVIPDQELVLEGDLIEKDTEAFYSRVFRTALNVERLQTKDLRLGLGLAQEHLEQDDSKGKGIYNLVSLPLFFDWDRRNDILNPATGYRLQFHVTPYHDLGSPKDSFFKYKSTLSSYFPLSLDQDLVWAAKAGFGQILGPEQDTPVSKRFFPGGGGSVRGFDYQSAGPLAADDTPLGGHCVLELSSELRLRYSQKWGTVVFLDGGRAYKDVQPDLGKDLFWGAGVGLRYYSEIGPLRLDIATPLNPRAGIDDPLQFYFSIGQAF
jgi:translocation and assembly module TamA